MGWEIYVRKLGRKQPTVPCVTIDKQGNMRFNAPCGETFGTGAMKHAELAYDPDTGRIAIRPCPTRTEFSRVVAIADNRKNAMGGERSATRICARGFARHFGIPGFGERVLQYTPSLDEDGKTIILTPTKEEGN